ncbi:hypothetical protein DL93DRAFT_2159580 [Clavulina sp. PMI_390]|nr:hypothetical protein DL93DRAFT_2159580 [Clavulina sp. PMI_390]
MITTLAEAEDLACRTLARVGSNLGFKTPGQPDDAIEDLCHWIWQVDKFLNNELEDSPGSTVKRIADAKLVTNLVDLVLKITPIASCDGEHLHSRDASSDCIECSGDFFRLLLEWLDNLGLWPYDQQLSSGSAILDQEMTTVYHGVQRLVPIWLNNRNLSQTTITSQTSCLLQLQESLQSLLRETLNHLKQPCCKNRPDTSYAFLIDSASFLLRVHFTIPEDTTANIPSDFIADNTSLLLECLIDLRTQRYRGPNMSKDRYHIDISHVTSRSRQEILSRFLRVVAKYERFQTTRGEALSILANLVLIDSRDDILDALIDVDYVTPSFAYAKEKLITLQRPTTELTTCYDLLLWSWQRMLGPSKKDSRTFHFIKAMLDQDFVFLLEAYVRAASMPTMKSSNSDFTIIRLIVASIFGAFALSQENPLLRRFIHHTTVVYRRVDVDTSSSVAEKQMWGNFVEVGLYRTRTWADQIPPPPEFPCGRPGCNSLVDAELRCSKCKRQCYCSVTCQKPDWKRHKKFCQQALS